MICNYCGMETPDGSAFCMKCGKSLSMDEKPAVSENADNKTGTGIKLPPWAGKAAALLAVAVVIAGIFKWADSPTAKDKDLNRETEETETGASAEGVVGQANEAALADAISSALGGGKKTAESESAETAQSQTQTQDTEYPYYVEESMNYGYYGDEEPPFDVMNDSFHVLDEVENAEFTSGMVQIGDQICYLGDELSTWLSYRCTLKTNDTGYKGAEALAYDDKSLARIYLYDTGDLLLEDCPVAKVCFGIQYNASITQKNAEVHLANPEPIATAGGLYIGKDFSEVQAKYGSRVTEWERNTKSDFKVYMFDDGINYATPSIWVDRRSGKICGIYWDFTK